MGIGTVRPYATSMWLPSVLRHVQTFREGLDKWIFKGLWLSIHSLNPEWRIQTPERLKILPVFHVPRDRSDRRFDQILLAYQCLSFVNGRSPVFRTKACLVAPLRGLLLGLGLVLGSNADDSILVSA